MLRFQIHSAALRESYLDRIAVAYLSTMIHRDALWILKLRKEKVSKMTMKKSKTLHRFAAVAAVLLAFCLVFMMPAAAYSGDGTETAPYLIQSLANLEQLATDVNGGTTYSGKYFKLTTDIDLNNGEWTPIGTASNPFKGSFDGDYHTISNLQITGSNSYVGLFGYTTNGEIKNLIINNAKVSGYVGVGTFAGSPYTSKYTNLLLSGHVEVNGFSYVGGMLGRNLYAAATNLTINVDETSFVNAYSIEWDDDEQKNIAYRTYVGGVIGFMGEGSHTVKDVKSNIKVTGSTCDVGGIVGIAHYGNNFENVECTATEITITHAGSETGAREIGGIAGVWHNEIGQSVTFKNCKVGSTTALSSTIVEDGTDADSTPVKILSSENGDFAYGGLTGNAYSSSATMDGSLEVTDENGKETIYQSLGGVIVEEKDGVKSTEIASAADLMGFAASVNAGTFDSDTSVTLTADIDLNSEPWTPIGTASNPFKGSFDGNGKTISNIKIENDDLEYAGLFGFVNGYGEIKDLNLLNVDITAKSNVGSVAGGAIPAYKFTNIVVDNVKITGNYKVGGFIGGGYFHAKDCVVGNSAGSNINYVTGNYKEADLEGDNVGGFVGFIGEGNYDALTNCAVYNTVVMGTRKVGGVAGSVFQNNKLTDLTASSITVGTNADSGYVTNNAKTMGVGGLVGLYTASGDNNGVLSGEVSDVTLTNPNNLAGVSMGYVTGGLRGTNDAPETPAETINKEDIVIFGDNSGETQETPLISAKDWTISVDCDEFIYDDLIEGYVQPEPATVTITNAGNLPVKLTLETEQTYITVSRLSAEVIGVGESATFTIAVNEGLVANDYYEFVYIHTNSTATADYYYEPVMVFISVGEKAVSPTVQPSSGSATDTGSGNYQYYPRSVPTDGIVDFGTSKVVTGMELPAGSDGTVTLNIKPTFAMPENGFYAFEIDAPGYNTDAKINGGLSFQIPVADLEAAGWTAEDIVLFHGTVGEDGKITWEALPTNLVKNENGVAYYKAAINGCSPFYIGFVKDGSVVNTEVVDPVTPETPETPDEPEVLPPVDEPETPEQPTESPAPILAVLAGLGAAVVLRRK